MDDDKWWDEVGDYIFDEIERDSSLAAQLNAKSGEVVLLRQKLADSQEQLRSINDASYLAAQLAQKTFETDLAKLRGDLARSLAEIEYLRHSTKKPRIQSKSPESLVLAHLLQKAQIDHPLVTSGEFAHSILNKDAVKTLDILYRHCLECPTYKSDPRTLYRRRHDEFLPRKQAEAVMKRDPIVFTIVLSNIALHVAKCHPIDYIAYNKVLAGLLLEQSRQITETLKSARAWFGLATKSEEQPARRIEDASYVLLSTDCRKPSETQQQTRVVHPRLLRLVYRSATVLIDAMATTLARSNAAVPPKDTLDQILVLAQGPEYLQDALAALLRLLVPYGDEFPFVLAAHLAKHLSTARKHVALTIVVPLLMVYDPALVIKTMLLRSKLYVTVLTSAFQAIVRQLPQPEFEIVYATLRLLKVLQVVLPRTGFESLERMTEIAFKETRDLGKCYLRELENFSKS